MCRGTEEDAIGEVIKVGRGFEMNARQHRMSSLQDLLAGRPLEIHETFGYALQKATNCRIALPLVEAVYHLLSAIDRTRFIPGTREQ
jgi:ketopantoate reductase